MDRSRHQKRVILFTAGLLICLLVLSAYSNTLYSPFALDDFHSFVKEQKVLGFTVDFAGFENLARSTFGIRRLLPMLTFVLNVKWNGASLASFHLTNIIIHLLATFSLLFLLQSLILFPKAKSSLNVGDNSNCSTLLVVFVVALWSLSPVQTNVVTYIVQRMTSLATLFYFLSLGCYLRGRFYHYSEGMAKKPLFFYFFSAMFLFCAMLSKEIFATWPVMVFLVEWLFIENSGLFTALKKHKKIVIFIAGLATVVIFYKFYHGWILGGYAHRHFTLSERLLTELRIVSSYCGILLLPLPQWLNLEHDVSLSTSLFSPPTTFFSLVFIVVVIFGAWRIRDKKPLITFAVFWFFINLVIESTVIPLELEFEHRLYLPSAGFYLALVLLVREFYICFYGENLSVDRIKVFACVGIIICSGLSFLTYTRNIVWGDIVSLYEDCISKAPDKARTHSNLATAWLKRGEYENALAEAEKAIVLGTRGYEEYWVAACNVVISLNRMGKNKIAIAKGESLLEEAPAGTKKNSYPTFLYNLGGVYFSAGDFQKAFNLFLCSYKLCYRNGLLNESAAYAQSMMKTLTAGLQQGYQFDPSMKLNTDNPSVVVDQKMAQIFFELNNYDLASKYIKKVLAKNENSLIVLKMQDEIERISASNKRHKSMGTLKEKYLYHPFSSRFNFFMALSFALEKYNIPVYKLLQYCLQQAEILNDSSPDFYIVKSWYFYELGEYARAVEIINQGLKLNSKYAQLWVNRGIYALADKNIEAFTDFDRALSLYPGHPHRREILAMQSLAAKLTDLN